jgi:G:T-mismatch repair DNA endonuclease (very short patch repair protein)
LFCCFRLQGTTKEDFIVDAIQLALEHHQLFIHHHVAKVVKVATKYHTNMGIPSNSSSSEK